MSKDNPHARLGLSTEASAAEIEQARRDLVEFLEGAPEGLRDWAQGEIAAVEAAYATLSGPAGARRSRRPSPLRRLAVGAAALAVTVGVVVAVYNIGGGEEEPGSEPAARAAQEQGLNPSQRARVARLMKKLEADPKDVATLVALGNAFFQAGDYNSAGGWMGRAVAIEPENVGARLGLGAAKFNLGDVTDARRDWLRVIALDPKNVEAYYDLGFLYLSEDPPEMAKARKMWDKVVALAPGSAVAKTVATHLKGLEKSGSKAASGR